MAESHDDFGLVDGIGADAIGQPGQRRFRLLARRGRTYASLWLEKESLAQLGTAIQQQIVRLGRPAAPERPAPLLDGSDVPATAQVDFRCEQLQFGYDSARAEFVLRASTSDSGAGEPGGWSGRLSVAQGRLLSREIERLVEGGRAKCPLCGLVLEDDEHNCPRSNGHGKELASG